MNAYLKQQFGKLDPETQKRCVQLLLALALVILVLIISFSIPDPPGPQPKRAMARHLLTDTDPRTLGIEGIAAEIREMRKSEQDLIQRISSLEAGQGTSGNRQDGAPDPQPQERLQAEIDALRQDIDRLKPHPEEAPPPEQPLPSIFPPEKNLPAPRKALPRDLDAFLPKMNEAGGRNEGPAGGQGIRVLKNTLPNASGETDPAVRERDRLFIPAGTLISGHLLNGLDAPTGTHARKEPYPVLIRVKEEAILPNRYRADIRECFLIGSGYGDLSAERAYIRAEIFSCIRGNGRVVEVPIDAYAVGEDGKLGLRGRVIDKQGQLMAESLLAGFANGFSSLFSRVQIPVVMAGGQNALSPNVPYQNNFSSEAAEGALLRGTGSALDRLANYYMDLAENLFPVVEIDVTRKIEFVIQRGFELKTTGTRPQEPMGRRTRDANAPLSSFRSP